MKHILIFTLFVFTLGFAEGQTCSSCPSGSAVTLDGSSYPSGATFAWTCSDGFTSDLQSPIFYPTEDVTCNLLVIDGPCEQSDQITVAVCDCECNDPCIDIDFDPNTECVTITEIGSSCGPVVTDKIQWNDDFGTYQDYTAPLCDCDIYEKLEIIPTCDIWNNRFRLGASNFDMCPDACYTKTIFSYANGPTLTSYMYCNATLDYTQVLPSDFINWGSSMTASYISETDWGAVIAKVKYTYNGSGLDCNNITTTILSQGKIYKDIWGKRVVTYSDGCPPEICEFEVDIPQLGDGCLLDAYINTITSSSCGGDAFLAITFNAINPTTYQWYYNGTIMPSETDAMLCVGAEPYGEYCCEIEDDDECTVTVCKIHQADCEMSVTITQNTGILTANLDNCNGTPTYSWYHYQGGSWVGVGLNQNTYDASGTPGTYKCSVVCDGDGCADSDNYIYTEDCFAEVNLTKDFEKITATVTGCAGTTITYVWEQSVSGGWNTVQTTVTTATTDYYYPSETDLYRCSIECDNGCEDLEQITWTEPNPCAGFYVTMTGPTAGLCVGTGYTYHYIPTLGNSPFTQTWKVNGVPDGNGVSYIYTPSSSGSVTISVEVVDNESCEASDSKIVTSIVCCSMTVSVLPATQTVCQNANATYTAYPSNGNPPYLYIWTSQISGGPIVSEGTGNPKTVNKSVLGDYNIEVTVTDDDNCQAQDNSNLTITDCTSCECEPFLELITGCQLDATFVGGGCNDFDWILQYSPTGTGWYTEATGGPPSNDFIYTPTENGVYRLIDMASGCSTNVTPNVSVNCACTAPGTIWFDDGAGGCPCADVGNNNLADLSVGGCDGSVVLNTLHGISVGEEVEISVSGDVTLLSPSTQIVGTEPMVELEFTNLDAGSSSMTVTYCGTDYVFNFVHDCCLWNITASLVTEGCYTEFNAGSLDIYTSVYIETNPPNNITVKYYINGIYVWPNNYTGQAECTTVNSNLTDPGWVQNMSNVLTATGNILTAIIINTTTQEVLYTSGTLLTFDCNNC